MRAISTVTNALPKRRKPDGDIFPLSSFSTSLTRAPAAWIAGMRPASAAQMAAAAMAANMGTVSTLNSHQNSESPPWGSLNAPEFTRAAPNRCVP